MLKEDLILQVISQTGNYQQEKVKKVIKLIKDRLGGEIMTKSVGLRTKTYSYSIDDNSKVEKAKDTNVS